VHPPGPGESMPRATPATENVAHPPDTRETALQGSFFARAGQLALPGRAGLSPAQLGLDGAPYAIEARSAEPSLGPDTPGFARGHEPAAAADVPPPGRDVARSARQLELWDVTWGQSPPQLSIWPAMRVRQALVPPRQAKCQRVRYRAESEVELHRSSSGRWRLKNTISCQRYTCPVCGRRRCERAAGQLGACFEAHRKAHPDGDQWMLTLAPPHRASDELGEVMRWAYDASSRLWRSREWRSLAEDYQIRARVRVLDATHGGANGSHPHFHVALFVDAGRVPLRRLARHQWNDQVATFRAERARRRRAREAMPRRSTELRRAQEVDREWELLEGERLTALRAFVEVLEGAAVDDQDDERVRLRDQPQGVRAAFLRELESRLRPAWRRELAAVGCPHAVGEHALRLSASERAEAYFVKWGLAQEVGLPTAKSRSHLRLLDVVVAQLGEQSDVAGDLYRGFVRATKGRAWVTGLSDACRTLGVDEDSAAEYVARQREREEQQREREGKPPRPEVPELHLIVRSRLWGAFLALGHERVFTELDQADQAAAIAGAELAAIAGASYRSELVQRALDGMLLERQRTLWRDTS
jgi:hypothetical protein